MTEQEKINSETNLKLALQDAKFAIFMEELKQQREDMRRMNEKIDTNQKEFTRQLHTNFVQTMIGVGAIMAAIGGLIIATLK